ncbi:tyrosine-type recombinase/integrase [Bifidobacterium sp. SO1]|uniref:tyrosine-type recombinase/integrase n=1 Tax=Bifidobacterium sp. SO1 TaxID=2809029 RepID=UPI001BDC9670|nr:tyrosine-type recombinase/integrase [Bifidobacterium sp. SO1]MBT1161243.1 tyrosine-type recombinase/integrase [Bifidobacterium sp. SO1]
MLYVTRPDIEAFSKHLEATASPNYRYSTLSAVRSLYRYAHEEGWIPDDPGALVRMPARPRYSTGTWLTKDEARRMMDAAARDPDPRAGAFYMMLLLTGIRMAEALALDVTDIEEHGDVRTVTVARKRAGGELCEQKLRLPNAAYDAIRRMLGTRSEGALFLSLTSRRLDDDAANRLLKRLAAESGIDKTITAHSLRRTFCTLSLDAGVSPRDIMASANWHSARMLQRYDCERAAVDRQAGVRLSEWLDADE